MSKFLKISINVIIILLCHQLLTINAEKERIVGGKGTTVGKKKYMISLRTKNGRFFCGASLVTRRFVLTAAHCIQGLTAKDFYAHGNTTFISKRGVRRSISNIITAKAFNMRNLTMDYAILKLSKPMQGRNTATIPLCKHKLRSGDVVNVSGWGLITENGNGPARRLRTTNVRMISHANCKSQYRGVATITSSMMCASKPGISDACSGDSGGPLVYGGELCGIVSQGLGCARKNFAGIYTSVYRVKRQIRRVMRKLS